ncbi:MULTISPECIES: hypothetical protein [Streptococcus]|uniref:Accessory secretory protein Asp4 n=1 Tax=Streptococcus porcorum TaxID=701526 RepID=A0ABV2JE10_9STRE|nr:hypothetical protein [Streptococcus sp.]MDY3823937.1 hypothetical protein [Streptococcus sp.]
MAKRNELLDEDILKNIDEARYKPSKKKKDRKPLFYLIVVFLVTLSVLLSLLRYL